METRDRITELLDRSPVRARLFHSGPLCGSTSFAAQPGRGFLHVLKRGGMTVSHTAPDGRRLSRTVREPSVVFYPRPLEHEFVTARTEEADFVCAAVHFDEGVAHPLVRTLPTLLVVPLAEMRPLHAALELLFAEAEATAAARNIVVDRLFEVVFIQLLRWVVEHTAQLEIPPGLLQGLAEPRIAGLIVAIHRDPAAPWTLERMAGHAAMSRSALAALFRRTLGQSPGEYLTAWRMLVASERLRAGDPVGRVAAGVGYASAAAFSRVFLRTTGATPRAWAAAVRDAVGEPVGVPGVAPALPSAGVPELARVAASVGVPVGPPAGSGAASAPVALAG